MSNTPGMVVTTTAARSPTENGAVVIQEGDGSRIRPNKSNMKLVDEDFLQPSSTSNSLANGSSAGGGNLSSTEDNTNEVGRNRRKVTKMEWVTVFVLFYVHLINYMGRFTLDGVLNDVKAAFNTNKSLQGLLLTVFVDACQVLAFPVATKNICAVIKIKGLVISYMVSAPIFGYMGDRYSRRVIMAFGVLLWSTATLAASFVEENFIWFVAFRAMVGIGEASFSTIAPTIISDLFLDDIRSRMLVLFYFAMPVGGVIGYIVGAQAATIGKAWYWSLRVTPVLGVVAVILILFLMVDPPRGEREGAIALKPSSWGEDCKYLFKNKSFILSTLGFTCVTFVTGALAWWGPTYIYYGLRLQEGNTTNQGHVSFVFGIITLISFIIGVPLGAIVATKLRTRNRRADPLVCAFGLLVSTPFILGGALLVRYHGTLCFVSIFFGELFLNLNWSIVADMLLYVVIPTRRATAEAFQILLSHALGDASSPYLIGIVADVIKIYLQKDDGTSSTTESSIVPTMIFAPLINPEIEFESLRYSLFTTVLVQLIGGLFFLATAWFIIADKRECDGTIALSSGECNSGSDPNPDPPKVSSSFSSSTVNDTERFKTQI